MPLANNQKGFFAILGLVVLLIAVAAIFYFGKQNDPVNVPAVMSSSAPVLTQNQNTEIDSANWTVYKNNKYSYSIKYPAGFEAGYYYAVSGELREPTGMENTIGFYEENPTSGSFLDIQVLEFDKTLKEIAEDNYKENTTHFLTKKFSDLEQLVIQDSPAYSYTFKSRALDTYKWSGIVSEKNEYEFKVVFIERSGIIYSIYFMNEDLFKKIFTTFAFTD